MPACLVGHKGSIPLRVAKEIYMDKSEDQSYEMKLRVLGNEVFAISLSSSSASNKWIVLALVSIFALLTVLGAYGEKFLNLYNSLMS